MSTTAPKLYHVNEVFYSIQGEGARVGSANVFLRFAFCNLQCSIPREGFNCDTDFNHGERMSVDQIVAAVRSEAAGRGCGWVIVTGGEPTLQLDLPLVRALNAAGFKVAIETNGTRRLDQDLLDALDWISVSPKRGQVCHLQRANECRVVLHDGQWINPEQTDMLQRSSAWFVSPAFRAPDATAIDGYVASPTDFDPHAASWCGQFVLLDPRFKLSIQLHKMLGVR